MLSIPQHASTRFFWFLHAIPWQFEAGRPALLLVVFLLALCPTSRAQATDDPALKMLTTLQQLHSDKPTLSTPGDRDRFCKEWAWLISEMKIDSGFNVSGGLDCNRILQLVDKTRQTPYSDPRFDWLRSRLEERVIAGITALDQKLQDRPVVGTLPVPYLNAKVIRVKNSKRSLIILNDEVFRLPYDTSKAVVQAIDFQLSDQGASYAATDREQINAHLDRHPEVVANLEFAVLRYLHQLRSLPPDGPPKLDTDLGIVKAQLYYSLVDAVEIFILAHEFGHELLQHLPDRHLSLLMTGSKASSLNVDEIVYSWRQEFEADLYGFLILEAVLKQTPTGRVKNWKENPLYPFLLSAPAFFFLSMQLVENGKAILETGNPLPATSKEDVELAKRAMLELFDNEKAPQVDNKKAPLRTKSRKQAVGTKSHPPFAFRFLQAQIMAENAKSEFFKDHKLRPGTVQMHRFAQLFQDTLQILFEKVNPRLKQKFDESNRTNGQRP